MKQNRIKSPKKSRTARSSGTARPCQERTAGRATTHGRACTTHGRASGARPAVRACTAGRALAARICGLLPGVHGRAPLRHARAGPVFCCFAVLWCPGRPQTSNLPWSYIWSPLSHRNLL